MEKVSHKQWLTMLKSGGLEVSFQKWEILIDNEIILFVLRIVSHRARDSHRGNKSCPPPKHAANGHSLIENGIVRILGKNRF